MRFPTKFSYPNLGTGAYGCYGNIGHYDYMMWKKKKKYKHDMEKETRTHTNIQTCQNLYDGKLLTCQK